MKSRTDTKTGKIFKKSIVHIMSVVLIMSALYIGLSIFGNYRPEEVYASSFEGIQKGNTIVMGIEPSASNYTGETNWNVAYVDTDNNKALVISKKLWKGNGTDPSALIAFGDNNTWDNSNAQKWCSNFYKTILNSTDIILETSFNDAAEGNYGQCVSEGNKVFLLSASEIQSYLASFVAKDLDGNAQNWWLRSPYKSLTNYCGVIKTDGTSGIAKSSDPNFMRPAFWLDLSKDICVKKTGSGIATVWTINVNGTNHNPGDPNYTFISENSQCNAVLRCSVCEKVLSSELVNTTPAVTKPATCAAKGETTYTATFSDSRFTTQAKTVENLECDTNNHIAEDVKTEYTWNTDNSKCVASIKCEACNKAIHSEISDTTSEVTKPATCAAKGETTYTATFTDDRFTTQTTTAEDIAIDPDAHGSNLSEPNYNFTNGNKKCFASIKCNDCNTAAYKEEVDTTSKVTKPATCAAKGETTYTATFTDGRFTTQKTTAEDIAIDPNAHGSNLSEPNYNFTNGNKKCFASIKCNDCSTAAYKEEVDTTSKVTKPATCAAKGETTYTATFADSRFTTQTTTAEDIAIDPNAHGSNLSEPNYNFTNGNKKCFASIKCNDCNTAAYKEEVDTTSKVTKPATCAAKGETTYTATFTDSIFATQTTTAEDIAIDPNAHNLSKIDAVSATCLTAGNIEYWKCSLCNKRFSNENASDETSDVSIPAKGHNWGSPEYLWLDDNNTCTATRICSNDSTHKDTETVTSTSEVVTPASCIAAGARKYTAVFTRDGFGTDTKTEEIAIDVNAHNWKYKEFIWAKTGDSYAATAVYECANNASHTKGVNTEVVSNTIESTCKDPGKRTFTATIKASASPDKVAHTDIKEEPLPLAAHDLTKTDAIAATCDKEGSVEYWTCSVCDKKFSDKNGSEELTDTVVPKAEHIPGEAVRENEVASSYDKDGSYDEVVYCSVCEKELSREKKIIPKTGSPEAEAVKSMIINLKNPEMVAVSDKAQIEAARAAYDKLPDEQKALIDSETVNKLIEAEKALKAAIDEAKKNDESAVTYGTAPAIPSSKVTKSITLNAKSLSVSAVKAAIAKAEAGGKKIETVIIGKNVKRLNKRAFKGTNVKTLVVKSKKLTKKSVKGSLKGSKITRIKVKAGKAKSNKKYIRKYRKIFTKKNAGRKVKVTK